MAKRKLGYPGVKEAERQKSLRTYVPDDEPDCWYSDSGGFCPNYEKFERQGFTAEETLVWLNVD